MFSRTLRSKWPIFYIAAYCMLLRTLQQYMCNVNLEPFIPVPENLSPVFKYYTFLELYGRNAVSFSWIESFSFFACTSLFAHFQLNYL